MFEFYYFNFWLQSSYTYSKKETSRKIGLSTVVIDVRLLYKTLNIMRKLFFFCRLATNKMLKAICSLTTKDVRKLYLENMWQSLIMFGIDTSSENLIWESIIFCLKYFCQHNFYSHNIYFNAHTALWFSKL